MALETEIAYFNEQAPELLANHRNEWVLIEGRKIVGLYRDFQLAITDAIKKFGDSPFLIRQIDAPPITLPHLIIEN